jgi:hypothetical protein
MSHLLVHSHHTIHFQIFQRQQVGGARMYPGKLQAVPLDGASWRVHFGGVHFNVLQRQVTTREQFNRIYIQFRSKKF